MDLDPPALEQWQDSVPLALSADFPPIFCEPFCHKPTSGVCYLANSSKIIWEIPTDKVTDLLTCLLRSIDISAGADDA